MRLSFVMAISLFAFNTATVLSILRQNEGSQTSRIIYNCGLRVFQESYLVKIVTKLTSSTFYRVDQFQGLLYAQNPNYRILRIPSYKPNAKTPKRPKYKRDIYFTIINQANHIVDVVALMNNGHYIKCKRIDNSVPEPLQDDLNESCGYECGHESFTPEIIQSSVEVAKSRFGKPMYSPLPFQGELYGPDPEYWIYPIFKDNQVFHTSKVSKSTYFIVVDPSGKLIDVVARLSNGYFIKCSKKIVVPDSSPVEQELSVGYLCGNCYFDIDHLKETADLARQESSQNSPMKFLKIYNGPPFHQDILIYPIQSKGQQNSRGNGQSKYFLAMNFSYQIIVAVMKGSKGIELCEESLRGLEAPLQEVDDFNCFEIYFQNIHLAQAAQEACQNFGDKIKSFPAKYHGPAFDLPGPYFTWPLFRSGIPRKKPGNFRIVINKDCQLSGVLVNVKNIWYKCRRFMDDSIPGGELLETISESAYKRKIYRGEP